MPPKEQTSFEFAWCSNQQHDFPVIMKLVVLQQHTGGRGDLLHSAAFQSCIIVLIEK